MTTRTLKNEGTSTIVIADLNGLTIAPGESVDGLQLGEFALRDSLDVLNHIINGDLSVSDGINTFTDGAAVDLIRGTSSQVTKDGKQIITTSDRPANTFRYYTSAGDDMVNHVVGTGPQLAFWTAPGVTEHKDIQFLEDIYIKDGQVQYWGIEDHCWLDMEVVVPQGVPFQAPAYNGNYDLINGVWTPNATNTGAYFINPAAETTIFRFVNKYPMTKSEGFGYIESPEPQYFPTPYKFRIKMTNNNTTGNMRAVVTISTYRKTTL